jgi:hypothetical protein
MLGNLSSVYGAQLYPAANSPRYIPGNVANAVFCLAGAILAVLMKHIILPRYKGPFAERPYIMDNDSKTHDLAEGDLQGEQQVEPGVHKLQAEQ